MDSKPDPKITALQRNQIDKMVEMAGEVLFEASAGRWWARGGIKELAHHLGRLYGETIRACRPHEGLKDEVQTTFMCGMALEPNFGREEVLRDSGAEAREEKTPGQLLYEKEARHPPAVGRTWSQLPDDTRLAWEGEAMTRAEATEREAERKDKAARALYLERFPEHAKMQEEKAKAKENAAKSPGQLLYERQVEGCGEDCPPWKLLDCVTMENLERDAMENLERDAKALAEANERVIKRGTAPLMTAEEMAEAYRAKKEANRPKACEKCTGTGNMSLLGEYEKCDAC